jgi:hypothetical protein
MSPFHPKLLPPSCTTTMKPFSSLLTALKKFITKSNSRPQAYTWCVQQRPAEISQSDESRAEFRILNRGAVIYTATESDILLCLELLGTNTCIEHGWMPCVVRNPMISDEKIVMYMWQLAGANKGGLTVKGCWEAVKIAL